MERSAWPKNLSSSRKHAIQDLLHGQNPTKKLRHLFDAHSQAGNNTRPPSFAEDLIVNVLRSFSNTLSESAESDKVLQVPTDACVWSEDSDGESISNSFPSFPLGLRTMPQAACARRRSSSMDLMGAHYQAGNNSRQPLIAEDPLVDLVRSFSNAISVLWKAECDEVLQVPTNACVESEVSEESESIDTPVPRKTLDAQTKLDRSLIDDKYQWRKYGQKAILNSEYPRNYFRCAHKIDSGCEATKQVQKIKDDPPVYRTIYQGHHTCKESHPQIRLSFNTSLIAEQDDDDNHPIFFNFLSVYHEQKLPSEDDENPHGHSDDDNSNDNNQPALSNYYADLESAGEI